MGIISFLSAGSFVRVFSLDLKSLFPRNDLCYVDARMDPDPGFLCFSDKKPANHRSLFTPWINVPVSRAHHKSKSFKKSNCFMRSELFQNFFYIFRFLTPKKGGVHLLIRKITSPISCRKKLLSRLLLMLQYKNLCILPPGCRNRSHQSRCAAADYSDSIHSVSPVISRHTPLYRDL